MFHLLRRRDSSTFLTHSRSASSCFYVYASLTQHTYFASSLVVSPLFEREITSADTKMLHMCFPFCMSISHGDLATLGGTAEGVQSSPILSFPAARFAHPHSEIDFAASNKLCCVQFLFQYSFLFHELLLHFPSLNRLSFTRYVDSRQPVSSFWFQFLQQTNHH